MKQSEKLVGILTRLNKKESDSGTYLTGWVETPDSSVKFFHQNSLSNRSDLDGIVEGAFVLFDVKTTKTRLGEREDVANVLIDCEKIIISDILKNDIPTIRFIFSYAREELKLKLVSKIRTIQKESDNSETLSRIENIKKVVPEVFQETKEIKKLEQQWHRSLPILDEAVSKTFLKTIFESNTPEYNENLFQILVDGLKTIDKEDVFKHAKFLLEYNSTSNRKIEQLNFIFYNRANYAYKFRMWFERLTDYCSTDILMSHFEKAEMTFKNEIINRCGGSVDGFLVLDSQVKIATEVEKVYFSGIRDKLLKELNLAKKRILIAVAWFTNDELFNVLCMKLQQGIEVELIIINDYINNWEFGLPFQTFVDLQGKLYFSEYPSIMHHKFCLIDNDTIFNGSYNWTYYAEMRNDENIMMFKGKPHLLKEFEAEFRLLKTKLGDPIVKVIPFDSSQINRFERTAFRQYFSNDLIFRAEFVRDTNITHAYELASKALDIDAENIEARNYKEIIQPEVQLQQRTIQVQNIVANNSEEITEKSNEQKVTKDSLGVERKSDNHSGRALTSNQEGKSAETENNSVVNTIQISKLERDKVVNILEEVERDSVQQSLRSQIHSPPRQIISNISSMHGQVHNAPPILVEKFSVPQQEQVTKSFKNLRIAIALDISGSMDTLYKNGTVQQVVEKLLAVALSISSNDQLDIWTFNDTPKRLSSVSKANFHDYISSNNISSGGGTNVSRVLVDIDKKYFGETTGDNVFGIVLTDGDIGELQSLISNSSSKPVFWQFVGLGNDFLKLNTLSRSNSNISFFSLNDINAITDEELYTKLLSDFGIWYRDGEIKGLFM